MAAVKGPGPRPSSRENPMKEQRSNRMSPLRCVPKIMTVKVKAK